MPATHPGAQRLPSLLVSPCSPSQHLRGWHTFCAALQRYIRVQLQLHTPTSTQEMFALIAGEQVDIIFANPFDMDMLMHTKGFVPVARPVRSPLEIVIAAPRATSMRRHTDMRAGMKVAATTNRIVKLLGLRLLEAAGLAEADLQWVPAPSFSAASRMVLRGEVDAALFLASSFHSMSEWGRSQMQVLLESHLHDITHTLLVHQRTPLPLHQALLQFVLALKSSPAGQAILAALDMSAGLEALPLEEAEFMIDLADTLRD